MINFRAIALAGVALNLLLLCHAQSYPYADLSNGKIHAVVALPDASHGFYRGVRFDWSGAITSLTWNHHRYFGPFFGKFDASLPDVDLGNPIRAGINSAMSGPVEEFGGADGAGLGYAEAKPGETFVKIGVGELEKPDNSKYSSFAHYRFVNGGKWSVRRGENWIEFTQALTAANGYAYIYRKTLLLNPGRTELTIVHTLKNTGRKTIDTSVFDHNFLVIDQQAPGPDLIVTFRFHPLPELPLDGLAEIEGHKIQFTKTLAGQDSVYSTFRGYGTAANDYDIRVENHGSGAGVEITGDQPLSKLAFWAIRTVVAPEPFVHMTIASGQEHHWTYTYRFFTVK